MMIRILSIMIVGFVCTACHSTKPFISIEQVDLYDEVSLYHREQIKKGHPIRFYESSQIQQIVLIRHGEPILDKKSARSRKGMKQYIYDYDTAKVHSFSNSPVDFRVGVIDTIYASPIVRAKDTANKLFGGKLIIAEDSLFREFEREVFPLPIIHLRPKTWGILSRIPWLLGLQSRNIEGFGNAKRRAKKDVVFLEQKANQSERVALVAHGFLNRYLSKYLQKEGWQLSYDGGKDYLSVQVLSKVVE